MQKQYCFAFETVYRTVYNGSVFVIRRKVSLKVSEDVTTKICISIEITTNPLKTILYFFSEYERILLSFTTLKTVSS